MTMTNFAAVVKQVQHWLQETGSKCLFPGGEYKLWSHDRGALQMAIVAECTKYGHRLQRRGAIGTSKLDHRSLFNGPS